MCASILFLYFLKQIWITCTADSEDLFSYSECFHFVVWRWRSFSSEPSFVLQPPDMSGRATVRVRQKYWPKLQVPEISRETFLKIFSPNLQFKRCAHALDKLVNFWTFTNKISPWSVWGMSVLIIMGIVTRI